MGSSLFLMHGDKATFMRESPCKTEDDLQKIIADNPQLLLKNPQDAGERLILIQREEPIEDGNDLFWLDHLCIDQDGVPVLVEVKRSTNTQIKREVVAQMMDYASRISSLNVDVLRETYEENLDCDYDFLQNSSPDNFWTTVGSNLKGDRMKLIFAADEIPASLQSVIAFLNRHFDTIETYGVEIHRYFLGGQYCLSSTVLGADNIKSSLLNSPHKRWSMQSFCDYLGKNGLSKNIERFKSLLEFCVNCGLDVSFGMGQTYPTCSFKKGDMSIFRMSCWERGNLLCGLDFKPDYLASFLTDKWDGEKLSTYLCDFPGIKEATDKGLIWFSDQYCNINLDALQQTDSFEKFKQNIKDVLNDLHSANRE